MVDKKTENKEKKMIANLKRYGFDSSIAVKAAKKKTLAELDQESDSSQEQKSFRK